MYIEDVIVHLSSAAGPRVGHLGVATVRGGEQIATASDSAAGHTLYGNRVEVLPTGWVRVHVSRDGDAHPDSTGEEWHESDVWLAPGEVVALTRIWNASDGPPGGRPGWEASWGTRRGEGK
mgnify:FL=1